MSPKVSIVMNCHNGERYLRQAIESIYSQTFKDWQIVFFDNASTDNSAKIAKSFDANIKYIHHSKLIPLGEARKIALEHSDGEWIAFLDTDDVWYPHKLSFQLEALEESDYIVGYGGVQLISSSGKKLSCAKPVNTSGNILEGLLNQFDINMVTPIIRKSVLSKLGINFDPIITASEEYNLFIRLAANGKFLTQDEVLGQYRIYENSLTDKQIALWAFERRYTLSQLEIENPGIKSKYPKAFVEAEARAAYYEAQYLMSLGKRDDCIKTLYKLIDINITYRVLYYLSYFPSIWRIIHRRKTRMIIINIARRMGLVQ